MDGSFERLQRMQGCGFPPDAHAFLSRMPFGQALKGFSTFGRLFLQGFQE